MYFSALTSNFSEFQTKISLCIVLRYIKTYFFYFNNWHILLRQLKDAIFSCLSNNRQNELRIDNVFLLEDDTIVIIDYESDYKKQNKAMHCSVEEFEKMRDALLQHA